MSVKEYAFYLEERRHTTELVKLMNYFREKRDDLENSYNEALAEISTLQDKVRRYEDFLRAIKVSPEAVDHYAETGELP